MWQIGDRIEVGGLKGDVVDVRLFRFTLLEVGGHMVDADPSTGRLVHVPNGIVFTQPIANGLARSSGDRRESRERTWYWLARDKRGRASQNRPQVQHQGGLAFSERLYDVKDSGVQLTGRFLVDPRKRRGANEAAWTVILDGFAAEPLVDLAYPTYRNIVDIPENNKNLSDGGGS